MDDFSIQSQWAEAKTASAVVILLGRRLYIDDVFVQLNHDITVWRIEMILVVSYMWNLSISL